MFNPVENKEFYGGAAFSGPSVLHDFCILAGLTIMDEPVSGIVLISSPITKQELSAIAEEGFGDMVKAVVDVRLRIMAIGGELHSDEEAFLLDRGSKQTDLWGINLYTGLPPDQWVEFDSVINIRPLQGNRSRSVDDEMIRSTTMEIVNELVK